LLHKIKKIFMLACNNIFGYDPVGAPTCLRKQEVRKPSLNTAQPYAKAEGCVHDDPPRADKLRKGWSIPKRDVSIAKEKKQKECANDLKGSKSHGSSTWKN